ncbi:MAG: hypothetical protein M9939_00820 [Mesorhizobium sp.]|nr:hypothetical protein [Mesorhizobium sp.]MCO5159650.1 hypothetical protein [Mesorhizobium sp.]
MNEPKWTPGPWRIAGKGTIRAGQGWIADVNWRNRDANARLIAAAPDLAEALMAAKVVIGMMERPEGMGNEVNAALDARLAKIDAALSKAKGQTP